MGYVAEGGGDVAYALSRFFSHRSSTANTRDRGDGDVRFPSNVPLVTIVLVSAGDPLPSWRTLARSVGVSWRTVL